MVACGAFVGLTGFFYWYISLKFADTMARRTKENFLESVLKQESAWFDANNSNELAARMTKESMSICKAVGEKPGLLLQAAGMSICGLTIGFTLGWSLALTMLAIVPVMSIVGIIFSSAGATKFAKSLKAYGQSAGYAEQALSAIKVVVAFGMESCEVTNYSKYLSISKQMGRKLMFNSALAIALFIGCLFGSYAYGFYMGGLWIDRGYYNSAYGRVYKGGDILGVFWGVLFGFFALSTSIPHIKAITEGKVAGKQTYDIIERVPNISPSSGKDIEVKGSIEFKDVNFYYPTRTDNMVLKNFSCTF